MKLPLVIAAVLFVVGSILLAAPSSQATANCTMVMGFSQTDEWYSSGFESAVGNGSNWQGLLEDGSTAIRIADPNEEIWDEWDDGVVRSKCTTGWQTPDRVILNISGVWEDDPQVWATLIANAVATTRSKLGNPQIVLQPVVGGPNHADCGTRASYNHPFIDAGIALAVAADPTLVVGFSPEVGSCSHYEDTKGHLTNSGAAYVAQQVASYYAGSPAPTNTPSAPTATPTVGNTATPTATRTATPTPTATPGKTITECRVRTEYSNGTSYAREVPLSVCQGLE